MSLFMVVMLPMRGAISWSPVSSFEWYFLWVVSYSPMVALSVAPIPVIVPSFMSSFLQRCCMF